jgi:hypothetical protein
MSADDLSADDARHLLEKIFPCEIHDGGVEIASVDTEGVFNQLGLPDRIGECLYFVIDFYVILFDGHTKIPE